jgi:hypothetical protein
MTTVIIITTTITTNITANTAVLSFIPFLTAVPDALLSAACVLSSVTTFAAYSL